MKKKSPEVSVVMSEFNTPKEYLFESINSVLVQTYKNFEFIIIDDSHDQKLKELIEQKYDDSRIKIIENGYNKGFVYSLNSGIKQAMGKYIMRMDTDDLIPSDRFEKLVNFIEVNPQYSVVSSMAVEFSGKMKFGINGTPGEKSRKDVMRGDTPIHAASIMLKNDLEDIGLYRNDFLRAEDLALWCELLLANKKLFVIDDTLYEYRVNPGDYKKRTFKNRKGEISARLYFYPKLGAGPIEYLRIIKSILAGLAPMFLIRIYRSKIALARVKGQDNG
ncbi:glycosyltransferase family 2 protein [Patescibacteria group bacterium]|nr:glycosyltransferase family 2 protein [Patescibacteria group bacterium]